ncbi:MAG TPA: MFS transporter [Methylophilaceae bacterium]
MSGNRAGSQALTPNQFAYTFVSLALISGTTIGMNKILVTLLALHLDAEAWQIGLLIGAESLSMMLMSLPAGVFISRYGARYVYAAASVGAMILYPLIAYAGNWYVAALLLFIAGVCIPFRVVSMNTSWLERLPEVGTSRGGWYRGTLMLGIGLLGPLLGNMTSAGLGVQGSYWIISTLFALMSVYGFFILSATRVQETHQSVRTGLWEMLRHLGDPLVRQVCIYDGMGGIVRGFFGTFIIVIAVRQLNWTAQDGIRLLVVEGATFVAVLLLLGGVVSRLGERLTYNIGHAALVTGLLLLGLSSGMIGLAAGAILQAIGQGFNHLVNVSRLAHSGRNVGHVSGLFTMVGMGGGFLGAMLGGLLSKGFVLQDIFLMWIPVWLAICPGVRAFVGRLVAVRA